MVYRLFIDVLRRRMEIGEGPDTKAIGLEDRASLLNIRLNRFVLRDFVFRCRVIKCT